MRPTTQNWKHHSFNKTSAIVDARLSHFETATMYMLKTFVINIFKTFFGKVPNIVKSTATILFGHDTSKWPMKLPTTGLVSHLWIHCLILDVIPGQKQQHPDGHGPGATVSKCPAWGQMARQVGKFPPLHQYNLAVQDTFFFNLMIPLRQLNPSQLGKLPFLLWSRMNLPSPVHQNISQEGISFL